MGSKNGCGGRALGIAVGIMVLALLLTSGAGAATLTVDEYANFKCVISKEYIEASIC